MCASHRGQSEDCLDFLCSLECLSPACPQHILKDPQDISREVWSLPPSSFLTIGLLLIQIASHLHFLNEGFLTAQVGSDAPEIYLLFTYLSQQ